MVSIPQKVFNEASASLPLLANAILSDMVVSQINNKIMILELATRIAKTSHSNSLLLAAILQSCKNLIVTQLVLFDDLYELFTVFTEWNSGILLEYRSIIMSIIDSYSSTSHFPSKWSSLQIQLNNRMLQNYSQVWTGQSPVRSRIPSANSSFVCETSPSNMKPSSLPFFILFAIIIFSFGGLIYIFNVYSPSQSSTAQSAEFSNYDSVQYVQEVHPIKPQTESVIMREEQDAFVIEDHEIEETVFVSDETVEFSTESSVEENVIDVQFGQEGYSTLLFSLFVAFMVRRLYS